MRLYPIRSTTTAEVRWASDDTGTQRFVSFEAAAARELDSCVLGEVPEGWEPARFPASKVICVGLNYAQHAEEVGKVPPEEPLIFLKPLTAIRVSGEPIHLPAASELVHHEAELAIVIGRWARDVSVEAAPTYVLGYTCANDVTARDIQRREQRYTRAKGYDSFAPIGPSVVTSDAFEVGSQRIECRVNGEVRQSARLDDFIFDVPTVVSFVSSIMTLTPGDLILTGTPSGVGPLVDGDVVEVEIEGIGVLENPVKNRA